MINFPDIHEEWYEFYDPHGNYIDRIKDYIQWLEVRAQIRDKELTGYYIVSREGIKLDIDKNGRFDPIILRPYSIVLTLTSKLF